MRGNCLACQRNTRFNVSMERLSRLVVLVIHRCAGCGLSQPSTHTQLMKE